MAERLVIVSAPEPYRGRLAGLGDEDGVLDFQELSPVGDPRPTFHITVAFDARQAVLDRIQSILAAAEGWRLTILPVEASLPRLPEPEPDVEEIRKADRARLIESREELYAQAARSADGDASFFLFVGLSTLVAAIGLIENNVAVVIGAMVIAPLLGPLLAFSLGVALGDRALMARALATSASGIALVVVLGLAIGLLWPLADYSGELTARTRVGFDGIALALASGAAAALSLTAGASSALVGVMVAVALMPPAVTIGLMAGAGDWSLAAGAALLLSVNVVCVNLAAQIAFVAKGVTPRTWFEKQEARRAVRENALIWAGLLLALAALLALKALRTAAGAA